MMCQQQLDIYNILPFTCTFLVKSKFIVSRYKAECLATHLEVEKIAPNRRTG